MQFVIFRIKLISFHDNFPVLFEVFMGIYSSECIFAYFKNMGIDFKHWKIQLNMS